MKMPASLKTRLSAVLLFFGLLLITANHFRNQSWLVERRIQRLEQEGYAKGTRLSAIMQHLFRKQGPRRVADLEMNYASISPELDLGMVCDSKDVVQFATRLQWRMMKIEETAAKDLVPMVREVRESMAGMVRHDRVRGLVTVIFPFFEGYTSLASGVVILRYDSSVAIAQVKKEALSESLAQACVLIACCLLLWLALDILVAQRVERMAAYARAVAEDRPPPPVLEGDDELALISRQFADAVEKLHQTELRLLESSELERRRIGRELHDDVCQRIAAAQLKSGVLGSALLRSGSDQSKLADEVAHELAKAAQSARAFARGLAPVWLGPDGFAAALEQLAAMISTSFSTSCEAEVELAGIELPVAGQTHIYRIVQELAINAAKHAKPVWIRIRVEVKGEMLIAEVENDGLAFDGNWNGREGLGMHFLQQRVRALGGTLRFLPRGPDDKGSLGLCEVPLSAIQNVPAEPPPR